ncbi:MAG TPA: AraC family transcriptional regulator [Verrucomicrobiota bacterium]|nr:AraC family transcriptional regulator [Verrucomicrobiota bacterium]HNU52309.1 AraC family transcriptional regulator [Verrucomicrobiota bacterium]
MAFAEKVPKCSAPGGAGRPLAGPLGAEVFAVAPGLELAGRLFERLRDVVFCVKDRQGRYVAANTAFAQRLGLRHTRDLLGKTARDFFPPQLAAVYEAQDAEVLATGRSVADKPELVFNLDGSLGWYLAQKEPVMDSSGRVVGLVGLSRDLRLGESQASQITAIATAVARIRREFRNPLRIEALAKETGLSLDAFERRFRKAVGISAREFLLRVRIEEAARLLRSTRESLATITADCGFYDQSAFTRHFRQAVGLTPSAYRRAAGALPSRSMAAAAI